MSKPINEYLITGRVGAAYGIRGWLKIHSFTEDVSQILQYNPWYLENASGWERREIEASRPHGKGLVVKFAKIENPETARLLTGKKISIKREQLTPLPPNEYYWADLEGLLVLNQRGQALGEIKYLLATGANDVLVIADQAGKEHAIPYLPGRVVKEIDLKQRVMHVEWELL